jgi:Kinesin motor domain
MYDKVGKQTITDFTNGFNGTIFAYGQSGSGKTFSMLGPEEVTDSLAKDFKSIPQEVQEKYGITVRAVIQMFHTINEGTANGNSYKLSCSYIEVYNEKIKCLLTKKEDLKIRENPIGGMYVAEKDEKTCLTPENVFECISLATKNRAVVSTNQNSRSSRSHTILMMTLEQLCVDASHKISVLNLVDLAGSERVDNFNSRLRKLELKDRL